MTRPFEEFRDEIVKVSSDTPFKIKKRGKSLCMGNHPDPCSIAPAEVMHLKNFVKNNKLMRGYEVATAFGISALAIGLGMKEHGGKLVTMDAYIEEKHNNCMDYSPNNKRVHLDSDGFKTASMLMDKYDLNNTVKLTCGFSPDDTPTIITEMFGEEKLDFVFIDALHLDVAVLRDTNAILPFLASKHAVFFHDVHCFKPNTKRKIADMLGKEWSVVPGCEHPGHGFNLAVVNNL